MWNTRLRTLNRYRRSYDGPMVGIEVEVEFKNGFDEPPNVGKWNITGDGSLRRAGYEFISPPMPANEVNAELRQLFEFFEENKKQLVESPRTSIHVHHNVQDLTWGQWLSCCTAYWLLEEVFMDYAGKLRKGNLFCLGAEEAGGCIFLLSEALRNGHPFPEGTGYKYAALNLESVRTLGTMEFRALGGTYNIPYVSRWVSSIVNMVKEASKFSNPRSLLEYYESVPASLFARRMLGDGGVPFEAWQSEKLNTNYSQLLLMTLEAENLVAKKSKVNHQTQGDYGDV